MKQKIVRQSNFELMRIIAMLFIVFYHFIIHGNVWTGTTGKVHDLFSILMSFLCVHVNSFVLLSGYFGYNRDIRLSKAIKINNSIWFYTVFITSLLLIVGAIKIIPLDFLKILLPISYNDYWFLTCYLILYLISPILNSAIKEFSQKKYKTVLLIYFIVLLLLPYLSKNEIYNVNNGYSIINFIYLYLLGAYLNKYDTVNNFRINKLSIRKKRYLFLVIYFISSITNFILYKFGIYLTGYKSNTILYIGQVINSGYLSYNNPFLIISTISFFLFFNTFDFKSNIVNKISSYVLGVYLITENFLFGHYIYEYLNFTKKSYNIRILPKIFIYTIIIFIICVLIEAIRQLIFKYFSKTRIAKFLRNKIINLLKKSNLEINW